MLLPKTEQPQAVIALVGSSTQSSYLSQISQIIFVEKFWRYFEKFGEILGDFATIYALSCGEKLSPKSTFVEKK